MALVLVNVALVGLNLDKQDALPFSIGSFGSAQTKGDKTDPTSPDDSSLSSTTSAVEVVTSVAPASTTAAALVDDWPGGHGPVPEGPPVARRAALQADGRMSLTGSVPDWATALQVAQLADLNLPGGPDLIENLMTWHPGAPRELQAGDVVIDQAAVFAVGQTTIDPVSFPALDFSAQLLLTRSSLFAVIIGHTDDVGDAEVNAQLAQDRATVVVAYLVGKGVSPSQLVIAAAGEDNPVASNETPDGRAVNRRIEIQFKNFLIPAQPFVSPEQ